ncbi:protein NO VEIN domain-containing protein [Metallibacterium scheffleri]|uniref:protein NO VEIN domain-containing protein n=1 Tax=Metallibacterium scheffleri TaxID=993689 RepID=UPI0023EF694A|nr:DUF3883 domain-containing protein [Metallibacterium scheffleri]
MANPLIVFRVGYMESYDGIGEITSGGSYVDKNGNGGEMWNFRAEGGRCYGYVMTLHFAGVDLSRIAPDENWKKNDELAGVDIVFIARRPDVGQVVIGWYRDATVFHKAYRKRRGREKMGDWDDLNYLCEVDAEQGVLLPEDQRTFPVLHGEKGYPGQSNVWYPPIDNPDAARFVAKLRKLIGGATGVPAKPTNGKPGGWRGAPGEDLIAKIEQAAVVATKTHFKKQGYEVDSFEQDNRGWDLEARKDDQRLLIEVKGHIGNAIQFELTPNEYSKLQENSPNYRICVLRNALLGNTDLEIYAPKKFGGEWGLKRLDKPGKIRFVEKIAARAFES